MTRLLSTIRLDAIIQVRSKFYHIAIAVGLFFGIGMGQLLERPALAVGLPMYFLFVVGSSTLLYVAALILFERDEGTLDALLVSPLRLPEYINAKIISLSVLVLFESGITVVLAYGLHDMNVIWLAAGLVSMSIILTLIGIGMIVRYQSITDFLFPVLVVNFILQLPSLYFTGLIDNQLWLLAPTSAPVVLLQGAWRPLETWEVLYGIGYSLAFAAALYWWAQRAFYRHIVLKEQ